MLNCFSFICHSHRCFCICSFRTAILHAITLIIPCNFSNCCLVFTCYLPISTLLHLCTFLRVRLSSLFVPSLRCNAVAPLCICKSSFVLSIFFSLYNVMLSHRGACVSVDLSTFGSSYSLHCNAPLCI